jgi:hypothetical protein
MFGVACAALGERAKAVVQWIVELYSRWFRHRLPTGEVLDLPMRTRRTEVFRLLGAPDRYHRQIDPDPSRGKPWRKALPAGMASRVYR